VDANNHDRWIISYADFITLLFAFFVVMYSISSVNQGKYKTLTESLDTAFSNKDKHKTEQKLKPEKAKKSQVEVTSYNIAPATFLDILNIPFESIELAKQTAVGPVDAWELTAAILNGTVSSPPLIALFSKVGQPASPEMLSPAFEFVTLDSKAEKVIEDKLALDKTATLPDAVQPEPSANISQSTLSDILAVPFESMKSVGQAQTTAEIEKTRELSEELLKERRQLNQVSDQLETALAPFIDDKLVSVKRNDYWIELEMNSELLFLSGQAALSAKAPPALKKIAQVVNSLPNAINVEGHTDNKPIGTLIFPSNWELSSARATSVVQELIKAGTDPTRLSAVGYGEFHPIGDNSTEEGRFKNRRVTLVLMSQAFSRYGANDEERAKLLNLAPTSNVEHSSDSKP